jgi:hypothetical protein
MKILLYLVVMSLSIALIAAGAYQIENGSFGLGLFTVICNISTTIIIIRRIIKQVIKNNRNYERK